MIKANGSNVCKQLPCLVVAELVQTTTGFNIGFCSSRLDDKSCRTKQKTKNKAEIDQLGFI